MRQRDLFEAPQPSTSALPEASQMGLIALLAQLMLSTLDANATMDEENNDEPDQC